MKLAAPKVWQTAVRSALLVLLFQVGASQTILAQSQSITKTFLVDGVYWNIHMQPGVENGTYKLGADCDLDKPFADTILVHGYSDDRQGLLKAADTGGG
ncbi:MAG: hypothetical protein IPF78_10490 [Flavobacteriales bacterium]|nr:hypothetical protein [Flavobacteriales bacterium]